MKNQINVKYTYRTSSLRLRHKIMCNACHTFRVGVAVHSRQRVHCAVPGGLFSTVWCCLTQYLAFSKCSVIHADVGDAGDKEEVERERQEDEDEEEEEKAEEGKVLALETGCGASFHEVVDGLRSIRHVCGFRMVSLSLLERPKTSESSKALNPGAPSLSCNRSLRSSLSSGQRPGTLPAPSLNGRHLRGAPLTRSRWLRANLSCDLTR